MNHPAAEKSALPKPIIKKARWPFPLIWLVPVLAAILAGYYYYDHLKNRGPVIIVKVADASGLKPGESKVMHLGVVIGQVEDSQLSPDKAQALIRIRLDRSQAVFARTGAMFWIVRPEISAQEISGLATVLSGPYFEATPGSGDTQTEFTGLPSPPVTLEDGLHIVLKAPHPEHLQPQSPVYFRGVLVGVIENVQLSPDADGVDVHVFIRRRFSPLVKVNSQFWIVSGIDVKGGLLGVQMKVESLRALLSGGIGFATPEKDMGEQATNGAEFVLHDEAKKDWADWAPKIQIGPEDSGQEQNTPPLPHASQVIRSAVGSP